MKKLDIDDSLKYGKQEILLDPSKKANKCGSEVDPLLFNDIFHRLDDGTYIKAMDYIKAHSLKISEPKIVLNNNIATITWSGSDDVQIKVNDGELINYLGYAGHSVDITLTQGNHTIFIKEPTDPVGLYLAAYVSQIDDSITVEFN